MIGISLIVAGDFPHWDYLAIESLRMNTTVPYHLCIANNGSNKMTTEYLRSLDISLIEYEENKGIVFARNATFDILIRKGIDAIAIIHSDMYFPKYKQGGCWLGGLLDAYKEEPTRGIISSCIFMGDKTIEEIGGVESYDALVSSKLSGKKPEWVNRANIHPCIYTRDLYEQIGFYDPRFPGKQGHEDWDYNNRAILRGFEVGATTRSYVWHGPRSVRSAIGTMDELNEEMRKNAEYFHSKWHAAIGMNLVPEVW